VVTVAPFAAVFNDYVRSNLGYRSDLPYIMLSEEVNAHWSWGSAIQGHVGVEDTLKGLLTRNRYFKVFVAAGYYDLDTPFYSSEYTFRHLGLPPGTSDNITFALYEAGHMVYTNLDALKALTKDVTAFYGNAVPKPAAPAGK
jgi:carboxypeptidase C (cathepsin A)